MWRSIFDQSAKRHGLPGARWLALLVVALLATTAGAVDRVAATLNGKEQVLFGKVLVKAQDGGLLLKSADGQLWGLQPGEIGSLSSVAGEFKMHTAPELSKRLLEEIPGLQIHTTAHYVIGYNTSKVYAQWVGALYERLYQAFNNFWTRKGLKLHEPETPLVVLVFDGRDSYERFAKPELGESVKSIIGYYSLKTNRVVMYDLTGVESLRQPGDRRSNAAQINAMLSRPEAEAMVATIIHEATHQITFNNGLMQRFADLPLWICEGMAVYFEAPDLKSAQGWNIGAINRIRTGPYANYLQRRPTNSLLSLISDDKRFRDAEQATEAYAEAWALNYYLIKQNSDAYVKYLAVLSAKEPLIADDRDTRIKEFKAAFGADLNKFDADFVRATSKLK